MNASRRHHYVPETLIKPWVLGASEGIVRGFYWNRWQRKIAYRDGGPKAFCCREDLLTVASTTVKPDLIETDYFGPVDTLGSRARDRLLSEGPNGLSDEEKSNFIRLLLSLDARRPEQVQIYRAYGETFKALIDADEEVQALARKHRINRRPSEWFEDYTGVLYEDEALSVIQRVSDNPRIGNILMGCYWSVRTFSEGSPELTLSDRPLLRLGGALTGNFLWLLPLSPNSLLCISPRRDVIEKFQSTRTKEVIHEANIGGALQSDRYVFSCQSHSDVGWLAKRLKERLTQLEVAS